LNFNHKRQQLGTPQAITRATQDLLPLVWELLQGWRKQPGHGMDPDIHRASGVLCAHLSHAVHAQLLPGSFACLVRVCVLCAFAICHSNTFFLGEVKLTTLSILSGVWCPLIELCTYSTHIIFKDQLCLHLNGTPQWIQLHHVCTCSQGWCGYLRWLDCANVLEAYKVRSESGNLHVIYI
jgi:hypothetical protein